MKYSILLLAVLSLASCLTPRERIYRAAKKDPIALAEICADEYPVKTVFKEGRTDTLVKTDTVREVKTVVRTVKGKPDTVLQESETVYKYIRQTDTLVQESTALSDSLRLALKAAELRQYESKYQADTWKGIAGSRLYWIIGLCLTLGGSLVLVFKGIGGSATGWLKGIIKSPPAP